MMICFVLFFDHSSNNISNFQFAKSITWYMLIEFMLFHNIMRNSMNNDSITSFLRGLRVICSWSCNNMRIFIVIFRRMFLKFIVIDIWIVVLFERILIRIVLKIDHLDSWSRILIQLWLRLLRTLRLIRNNFMILIECNCTCRFEKIVRKGNFGINCFSMNEDETTRQSRYEDISEDFL